MDFTKVIRQDHPSVSTTTAPVHPAASAQAPAELEIMEPETEEQVLVVGGYEENRKINGNIVFVDSGHTIPQPFADFLWYSACSTGDGLIVSGGYDPSTKLSLSKIKIFSLKSQKWTDLPDLQQPTDFHGSVYVKNRYYTVGGICREKGSTKRCEAIQVLDLTSLQWSPFSPLQVPVSSPGVAHVQNRLFVFGGDPERGDRLRDTYSYDLTTRERRTCQPMPPSGYFFLRTTVAADNHVYLLCRDVFLQYDVVRDTWSELTSPTEPSSYPAMVLHDNRLLVLGGFDGGTTSRIQSYDPASNKWGVERRTMPAALQNHWAIVVKTPKPK